MHGRSERCFCHYTVFVAPCTAVTLKCILVRLSHQCIKPNPSRGAGRVSDAFLPGDIKGVVILCHLSTFRFTPPCLPTDERHRQLPEGCPPTPPLVSSGQQDRSRGQSKNSPSANSTINTTPTPESLLHRKSIEEVLPLFNLTGIYPDN